MSQFKRHHRTFELIKPNYDVGAERSLVEYQVRCIPNTRPGGGGEGGGLLKMPYELRLFESQIVLRSDDAATFDKDFFGGVFFVRNKVLMTKRKEKITLSHTHTNLIQHNPSRSV